MTLPNYIYSTGTFLHPFLPTSRKRAIEINSAIHQSGGSLATGRFTVSTGTIPKNGHIPSMGERPGEAVASGGLPAGGLVNSTVTPLARFSMPRKFTVQNFGQMFHKVRTQKSKNCFGTFFI